MYLQIDVAGTMQFWDISIDTASSVLLILCFGLAVDYSAHIGHSFMTHTGNKNGIENFAYLEEMRQCILYSIRCLTKFIRLNSGPSPLKQINATSSYIYIFGVVFLYKYKSCYFIFQNELERR